MTDENPPLAPLRVRFILPDDNMPRTVYWQEFVRACGSLEEFHREGTPTRDIHVPTEDLAIERNWPRYARRASAYVRGNTHDLGDDGATIKYLRQVVSWSSGNPDKTVLLINMHPFIRIPLLVSDAQNIIIADGCLSAFDRCVNPRTISLPALPINAARDRTPGLRRLFASFQGAPSHPIRERLARLHDGQTIVVKLIDPQRHDDLKLDAVSSVGDREYQELLSNSIFAFVPRGDALFSYRLLEALSFGCIPVILSDGWVLPLDRSIPWPQLAYVIHHDALEYCVAFLRRIPAAEILRRQALISQVYSRFFQKIEAVAAAVLAEAHSLMS
jgi:Exostosin family